MTGTFRHGVVRGAASGQQLFVAFETDVPACVANLDGFPNLT